jgi:Tfp pilus assembly protein FimT
MIEALIVLAVAAILATMSFSYLVRARPAGQLHSAELEIASFMGKARDVAYNEEVPSKVVLDFEFQEYWIEKQDQATGNWEMVTERLPAPEGVSFASTTFPDSEVVYTPRGTLVVGGDITLQNSLGDSSTLTGNVATGRFAIGTGGAR